MNSTLLPTPPTNTDIDFQMTESWNSTVVSDLIRANSSPGESPAYLFVGHHEAALLRAHLGAAFGDESVASLKLLYYMGLEVVEIDLEHCLRVAGRKVARTTKEQLARRPAWRDRETDSLWHLRIA